MHLILLPVTKVFNLSSYYLFNWFFIVYNIGVLVTIGMMFTKGTYQVMGLKVPESFAGYAGMGHTVITAGFILLFFLLKTPLSKIRKIISLNRIFKTNIVIIDIVDDRYEFDRLFILFYSHYTYKVINY